LERKIITTLDGSTTIQLVEWDECYHSKNGAIQEAYHVFIKNGLEFFENKPVSILEIGFGTGLNALITYLEAEKQNQKINYTGVEAYPVSLEEAQAMNYPSQLNGSNGDEIFKQLHVLDWEVENKIGDNFILKKRKQFFNDINDLNQYDLIYFDAFGFQVQPELWTVELFLKMFNALKESGVLVTYAARGVIKRNLKEVGFEVKKVPGPPGKREMMIAFKNF
jgi:tRNA U34 5-methylaminomethyl-2-thiouridine-forming methyltransferase MnmC